MVNAGPVRSTAETRQVKVLHCRYEEDVIGWNIGGQRHRHGLIIERDQALAR